jgi:uncharacterized membrane protein
VDRLGLSPFFVWQTVAWYSRKPKLLANFLTVGSLLSFLQFSLLILLLLFLRLTFYEIVEATARFRGARHGDVISSRLFWMVLGAVVIVLNGGFDGYRCCCV